MSAIQERNAALFRVAIGLGDAATKDVGLNAETVAPGDVVGGDDAAHAASHENGGSAEINVGGLSGVLADAQTPITPVPGAHRSDALSYVSGTGTAGTDNTAQTIKTITLPANTLTQAGDVLHVRCYFVATGATPIVGAASLNTVLISDVTVSSTNLAVAEAWLHYIDNTHANVIHMHDGALSSQSGANVAGFSWNSNQDLIFTQDAVAATHLVLYAAMIDVLPKGV